MARHPTKPRDVARTAFYSLWGVLTLVLLFGVTFMFMRLTESQRELEATMLPAPRTRSAESAAAERPLVRLYFAHPSELRLVGEDRPVALTGTTRENCRAIVAALVEGPTTSATQVLPAAAKVRAMYLLESGELIIDFSRDIDAAVFRSAGAEWLMMQSLAHTLTQPGIQGAIDHRPVNSVRLLYEGSPAEETFPAHILLTGPVKPDPRLVGG